MQRKWFWSGLFPSPLTWYVMYGFEINVACVGAFLFASIPYQRLQAVIFGEEEYLGYPYIWPSVIRQQLTLVYYPCGGHYD